MRHKRWSCSEMWLMKKKIPCGPLAISAIPSLNCFIEHAPAFASAVLTMCTTKWNLNAEAKLLFGCFFPMSVPSTQPPKPLKCYKPDLRSLSAEDSRLILQEHGLASVLACSLHHQCQQHGRIPLTSTHNMTYVGQNIKKDQVCQVQGCCTGRSFFRCYFTLTFITLVHWDQLNNQKQGKISTNTPINVSFLWSNGKLLRHLDAMMMSMALKNVDR